MVTSPIKVAKGKDRQALLTEEDFYDSLEEEQPDPIPSSKKPFPWNHPNPTTAPSTWTIKNLNAQVVRRKFPISLGMVDDAKNPGPIGNQIMLVAEAVYNSYHRRRATRISLSWIPRS